MTEPAVPPVPDPDPVGSVEVLVVDLAPGREISARRNLVDKLRERASDVQSAIIAGARAISADLDQLPQPSNWQVSEVSATFGVALTAEAGVVVSRATAEATFEVTVTFKRK